MELKAENIHKAYNAGPVLQGISFVLEKGQKVGLVGHNGTGKTTLLKILAGLIEPDYGEVTVHKGVVVGYVPQDTSLVSDETIRDYVRRVSGMAKLESQIEKSPEAMEEYERRNCHAFYHRLDIVLAGFSLSDVSTDRPINTLSSGQRSKVFITGMLLSDADILLLDEPTNNLDLPALIWLERFLARTKATCVIVSHDRFFLDRLVRKIFEIHWHTRTLVTTNGTYSDYLARRGKETARQRYEHEAQQEEIQRLEDRAKQKKRAASAGSHYTGSDNDKMLRGFKRDRASKSGKQAKVLEKRVEQMEIVEKPVERDALRISIRPEKPKGTKDVALTDLVAGYSEKVFKVGPVSLDVSYGSRVAILGSNGTGKTTLLRTISGELSPLSGNVLIGSALVIGNLTQEHNNLPREQRAQDFLMQRTSLASREAGALLATFGFRGEDMRKTIGVLSPGERARLLFALFSALSVNLLLLDEPTNHLDLEALEALQEMLAKYRGTVILVSHDRHFLESFHSTETYLLAEGKLKRLKSLQVYVTEAEQQAKRLIRMI